MVKNKPKMMYLEFLLIKNMLDFLEKPTSGMTAKCLLLYCYHILTSNGPF